MDIHNNRKRNFFLLKGSAMFEERSQKSNHRKV